MVHSAGLLVYRHPPLQVLIAHPGGPFWRNKHEGAWSIPKGIVEADEAPLEAALREFVEETSLSLPAGAEPESLGDVTLRSGKRVSAWAVRADVDETAAVFGTFVLEWPLRSGRQREFPEIDELRWVSPDEAAQLLNPAQVELVRRLAALVG